MLENEVVVGLDDSVAAQAALQWAARYARFTYTDVRVIHVPTCSVGASIAWSAGVPGIEGFFFPEPDNLQRLTLQHMFEAIHPEPGWVLEYRDGCPGSVLVTQSTTRNCSSSGPGTAPASPDSCPDRQVTSALPMPPALL
jgi:hypothetical protein